MHQLSGESAVYRLAQEKPEWIPIVEIALDVQQSIPGEEFAGKWVLDKALKQGIDKKPNLRTLASYEIIEKKDTARSGRRAYYAMPDPDGVQKALSRLKKLKEIPERIELDESPQS